LAHVVRGRGVGTARLRAQPRAVASRATPGRPVAQRRSASSPAPLSGLRPHPIAALETRAQAIRGPVEKLRFLRRSLERYETLDQRLQAVPGAPLRWLASRVTGVEEARALFSSNPWGALDPPARSRGPLPRRARRAVNAAALLLVVAAGLALALAASAPARAAETLAFSGGGLLLGGIGSRVGLDEVTVEQSGDDDAAVVLGKYLSPNLFVSYGISIAEAINTIKLRYTINRNWSLKAEAGLEQSADVEYRIER